jgi:3-deoxy-D-manno-octulosonic-acid transferase
VKTPDGDLIPNQSSIRTPVIVAGSTYAQSEEILFDAYLRARQEIGNHLLTMIVVPHEPTTGRLAEIDAALRSRAMNSIKLSEVRETTDLSAFDVIVIDAVGMLAGLYRIGDITFVGGSFRGSVHNVMEPAVMGNPLMFGPHIANSLEAKMMLNQGGAVMVKSSEEMARCILSLIRNPEKRIQIGEAARDVVISNLGATEKTLEQLEKYLSISQ